MPEYNWKDSLDFRFYDFYERSDVNLIYIDEENPSSIALKFEIRNQSGIELVLEAYNQETKQQNNQPQKTENTPGNETTSNSQDSLASEREGIVSADNFHIELRFRPGTLSAASLVQLDLSEASKEDWLMSRPIFHENKEVSLYLLKCGRTLKLVDTGTTTFTLRGFAANSAGGSRGTNVIINYNKFKPVGDTVPLSGTKVLNLTILGHRGQRKAPLAICFANQNTILNNGELSDNIELQITNISSEAIPLSPKTEFIIELDAQAEGKDEPWAVAKKDEAANFNIAVKKREIQESNDRYWSWNINSSTIDKNTEEPRFTFRDIYRQVGSKRAVESLTVNRSQELQLPKNLESNVLQFKSDPKQVQVAYPGTVWQNGSGYSLVFQEDGNLVIYNGSKQALWATGTYQMERRADMLKFHPSGNLVLYQKGQPIWSTHTQKNGDSQVCLELRQDGNLVIYNVKNSSQFLFETKTQDGIQNTFNAVDDWKREPIDTDDNLSDKPETSVVLESEYSFPSNEDLIFVLSNTKSSLPSGQGQIRFYYKNIPGYADGYQILNLYKTHLVERDKKIGIGKVPATELDVKGTVTATAFVGQGAAAKGMIMMWSGTEQDVPRGWKICNGQNGTPDLRDRFIVGAGAGGVCNYKPGASGDPDSHIHAITVPKIDTRTSDDGVHSHRFPSAWYSRKLDDGKYNGIDTGSVPIENANTQDSGQHSHSVTISFNVFDSGFSKGENRPRWYALCFIMYTG